MVKKDFVRYNDRIRVKEVRVVYQGNNLGIMATYEALRKARSYGLDLVEVAAQAKPPVCHIIDYGKFMYDKQKREKSKAPVKKEKEISFRYVIGDHDLETKANQARNFIQKGMKVKLVVKFKSREKIHKDQGFLVLRKLIEKVLDVASVEKQPTFEGHNVIARLDAKKGNNE